MRKVPTIDSYVVYQVTIQGKLGGVNAVCSQQEWEDLQREQPGIHKLILAGIRSEAEAEQVARDRQALPPTPPKTRRT